MKKLLLVLALGMFSFGGNAQVIVDGVDINKMEELQYVELVGQTRFINLTKIKVFVDYGQNFSWRQQTIEDVNGERSSFNSMVDALNFMYENGWEFVSNYHIDNDGSLTYHYILQRQVGGFDE
ncbi:MAG: hypothetical protein ACFHU9_13510 [Fluviicola sp.]